MVTCKTRPYYQYTTCNVWINVDGQQTASAPSFAYDQYSTPILAHIYSPVLTPSGLGRFNLQPLTTDATQISVSIGQESTLLVFDNDEGEYDLDAISSGAYQDFYFDTGNNNNLAPGYYNITVFVNPIGNALSATRNWFYTPDGRLAQVSVLPNISSLSMQQGSSQGAIITVYGSGFPTDPSKITAKLGTQSAQVLSSSFESVTLRLPKSKGETGPFKTHAGLQVYEWDNSNRANNAQTMRNKFLANSTSTIASARKSYFIGTTETSPNEGDNYIRRIAGWFESPVNGTIRFYVSGDDIVNLYFNPIAGDTTPPTDPIAQTTQYTAFRDFYQNKSQISAPVGPLVAGSQYWIEIWHAEGTGGDHMTVGFTFDQNIPSDTRPTNLPTVFEMKVSATQIYDKHTVTVSLSAADKEYGAWALKFTAVDSSGKNMTNQTAYVPWNATAAQVSSIFNTAIGQSVSVNYTLTKSNGSVAADFMSADVIVYTVTLLGRRVRDYQTITSNLTKNPVVLQTGYATPQLSGSFVISLLGTKVTINVCDDASVIPRRLVTVPSIIDPILTTQVGNCYETGRTWRVVLDGTSPKDVPFPTLASVNITGGAAPTVTVTGIQNGSTTEQIWNTIPPYLLQASSDKLEVSLQVNEFRALATGPAMYSYLPDDSVPQISAISRNGKTLTVTLDNVTDSSFSASSIDYFAYSGTPVTIQTVTATSTPNQFTVTATLAVNSDGTPVIVAGDSIPEISIVGIGFAIPHSSLSFPDTNVLPTVSAVSPSTGSTWGFTNITITGKNFGYSLSNSYGTAVTFGGAPCKIQSLSNTQIVCVTGAKVDNSDLKITVNGKNNAVGGLFTYTTSGVPTYTSSSPSSANPTLHTTLELNGNFGSNPNAANFQVFLDAVDSNNAVKEYGSYQCYVTSVDASLLKCLLAGGIASPTLYNVRVIVSGIGAAIPSPKYPTFQFKIVVSSISPSSGSFAGGTLLTITGQNFPADIAENQVTIGSGVVRCKMISATTTTLTCMTGAADSDYQSDAKQQVYVLSRIQDEATCSPSTACQFTYSNSKTPNITAVNVSSGVAGDTVRLTGTNLNAESSQTVNVTVGGVVATVDSSSLSSTGISFKVPGKLLVGGNYTIQVHVGNKGYATFATPSLSILTISSRKILDITPKTLSQGGGILTITGGGFNTTDTVKVNGATATIVSRSLDQIQVLVAATTSASLPVVISYTGGNITAPSSIAITTSNLTTPIVKSVAVVNGTSGLIVSNSSAFTLNFTGTNLALEAPTVTLKDKSNSSAVYTSTLSATPTNATTFLAGFENVVVGTYSITINYPNYGYAKISVSPSDITINWTEPTVSSSPLSSSIAGGAEVTISGNGFPSSNQSYEIDFRVCGVEGEIVSTSANQIVARVPPFVTKQTLKTYDLAKVSEIFGAPISDGSATAAANIFDGVFSTYYSSSAATCYIGVDFGANAVGILSKIKYFPQVNAATDRYVGVELQGSNDNVTWSGVQVTTKDSSGASSTESFIIGYEIHNGYNDIIFDETDLPSYRYYRFVGSGKTLQCNFAEIQFWGILASSNANSDLSSNSCDGVLTINGKMQTFPGLVNYQSSVTPVVTNIQPSYASANGGEQITITGKGFPVGQTSAASVTIDGVPCDVSSVTATSVVCTSRPAPARNLRPQALDSSVKIWFDHSSAAGYAAGWQSLYFLVTERWSASSTWGGLPAPGVGDSVYVPPGLSLLVDTNVNVYAVIVQGGAIVFSDEADYTFDAHYVFIRQGIFRAGTPERPYTRKLTITMHGSRADTQLPTYGNKNIALREGILDLNGVPRTPTWTFLAQTALSGATTITLLRTVDWKAGEEIVLASSTHEHSNSETAVIQSALNITINGSMVVTQLTLTTALKYNHYSKVLTFTKGDGSSESISMRTEVGLLSRNIIFQGDSDSPNTEYGAHIMIHSPGDESSMGRISYIRVRQAGQAYILGRYPIHFHLIGSVSKSFVKGNAIHHTYNRATTIHGVHYLTVQDNVVYWCKGHNIFVEDGIETNNLVQNNLVISTLRSWSLLNTDQTPASFWITNPNNMYIGNHAAGSDRYGFWFDLKPNPTGPSYTPDVCPQGTRLGAFRDNVAHSNGRYGLRIFHLHTPTVDPCSALSSTNPSVPALYQNFTGFKNKRAGIIGETLGELTFTNLKFADNLQSGIELTIGGAHAMQKLVISNVLAVGLTENAADNGVNLNDSIIYNYYWDRPTRGIVTTRNDGVLVSDVRFYDWPPGTVAFMDCSHCEKNPATDSGARTAFIEKVYYSPSFKGRKIQWNIPLRGIFRDLDGTLTGKKGWATAYFPHNDVPECTRDETNFNGLICNDNVQVRRIVFYNYAPNVFEGIPLYIFNCNNKSQGAILNHNQCNTYQNSNYDIETMASKIEWRRKQNPAFSWAVGFVTGYTYNPYWGPQGIDFDLMTFSNTPVYEPTDKVITLAFNHSNYRETFDLVSGSLNLTNRTTPWTADGSSCKYGDWQHDPTNKRLYVCVNGNQVHNGTDPATNTTKAYNVTNKPFVMNAVKCRVNCPPSYQDIPKEAYIRSWSNASDWILDNATNTTNGTTNKATRLLSSTIDPNASEVVIPAGWRMRVDVPRIPQTPNTSFKRLEIRGDLIIDEVSAAKHEYIEIFAEVIWVRGSFFVGSDIYNETSYKPLPNIRPYNGRLRIYLTGDRNSNGLSFDQGSTPGNKVFATTGTTTIVGKPRSLYKTKLAAIAKAGDKSITVIGDATSWPAGSLLGISPTAKDISEFEYVTVSSTTYDSASQTTTIKLDTSGAKYASYSHSTGLPLKYDHYGCTTDEAIPGIATGRLDVRAEVALLSREIVITANELKNGTAAVDDWGATIYSSEVSFPDPVTNTYVAERGALKLDNIQCDFCGQADTNQGAIHLEYFSTNPSVPAGYVINSVISGSNGIGIDINGAADFTFNNNVIFQAKKYGVNFEKESTNFVFSNNLIVGVEPRNVTESANDFTDLTACIYAEYELLGNSSIIDNTVVGCAFHGFIAMGGTCGKPWVFKNNVARISDYLFFITAPNTNCTNASGMVGYGALQSGVTFVYPCKTVYVDNVIAVDSGVSFVVNQGLGVGSEIGSVFVENVFIGGAYYPYSSCAAKVKSTGLNTGGCSNRLGFLIGGLTEEGKVLPPKPSKLPWYGLKSYGGWGGIHRYNNVQVKWFEDNSEFGCSENYVFQSNENASDNNPVTLLSNFKTVNVSQRKIMKFTPPGADWIGIDNCGNWPCTGIKNILVKDLDGSLTGAPSSIIPQNDGVIDSSCQLEGKLSYRCTSLNWGLLTFQSLDVDKEERLLSPINLTSSDGFRNDINTFMDHCWDGFYTCLKRLSRFPTLVRTGQSYNIKSTGTLPDQFQFRLFGATNNSDWVLASLQYTQGTAVAVHDSAGKEITPKVIGPHEDASFNSSGCGAYTYEPTSGLITFKITGDPNCTLLLVITNTVYASVRYRMSVDEFYASDGPTKFIDNLAAVLKIPTYKIRIVSISQGGSTTPTARRLLKDPRRLAEANETVVEALVDLPDEEQGGNVAAANETAKSYITALNEGISHGLLTVGTTAPETASFESRVHIPASMSNSTSPNGTEPTPYIPSTSSNAGTVVAAVVITLAILVVFVYGYVRYKRSKLKIMTDLDEAKAIEISHRKSVDTDVDASRHSDIHVL